MIKLKSLLLEFTNRFRGWISPDGREFNTNDGGTHDSHAQLLLKKFYPTWDWESSRRFNLGGVVYAEQALMYKGWIRTVDNGIYSIYKMTPQIKSTLIELISELPKDYPVYIDMEIGRSLRRSTSREALDWLDEF